MRLHTLPWRRIVRERIEHNIGVRRVQVPVILRLLVLLHLKAVFIDFERKCKRLVIIHLEN
jgi:hypothetical protein